MRESCVYTRIGCEGIIQFKREGLCIYNTVIIVCSLYSNLEYLEAGLIVPICLNYQVINIIQCT